MFTVIKPIARQLSDEILDVIDRVFSNNYTVQTVVLSIFVAVLLLIIIFFILPYMNSMRNDVIIFKYVDVKNSLFTLRNSNGNLNGQCKVYTIHWKE